MLIQNRLQEGGRRSIQKRQHYVNIRGQLSRPFAEELRRKPPESAFGRLFLPGCVPGWDRVHQRALLLPVAVLAFTVSGFPGPGTQHRGRTHEHRRPS
jgi:hypothetical protein